MNVKCGQDAERIGVIDIYWPDSGSNELDNSVELVAASSFAADSAVMELVEAHEAVLPELEEAVLCEFPPGVHMTSKGMRLEQSTMGTSYVAPCVMGFELSVH